jgi:flotillin
MTTHTLALLQDGFLGGDTALALIAFAVVLILFSLFIAFARRYKRCPSNRILVVYGRAKEGRVARTLHGGGTFVLPLLEDYEYMSLDPMQIEIPLEGALSIENIRVAVPSVFTVAIGTDSASMSNASQRLLGLTAGEIMKQAEDIIFGQLRQVIASMRIEEINRDRDVFLSSVQSSLEPELKKIGLILINVNIKDITDESGYIEAIGRKAASEAIQQALIDVAEQEKRGAIGVAEAERERAVQVANAERTRDIGTTEASRDRAVKVADLERERLVGERQADLQRESQVRQAEREMRISVAEANAQAVAGENTSKANIASSNAELKVREAEAYQSGETKRRVAEAAVLEAQYLAEAKAAEAEAKKLEAEKRAQLEAVAKAEKAQTIVDAQAAAEKRRIEAEGEASAIFAKLDAEARGQFEILAKKGAGLRAIVEACGGSQQAFQLMMLEHLDKLSETAATAISNIKFDKVVVWDNGTGGNGNGGVPGFVKRMGGALPPLLEIMRDIGGVEMPEYFGKLMDPMKDELKPTPPPDGPGAPDARGDADASSDGEPRTASGPKPTGDRKA